MHIDKNKIQYRKVQLHEVDLLVNARIDFLLELQGAHSVELENKLRKELAEYFTIALANKSYIAWIAEYDGLTVGFSGMVIQQIPGSYTLLNGLAGYILNIFTLQGYRKNGICNALLDRLIDEAKTLGLAKVYLNASNDGIELYRKKGFTDPHLPELELFLYSH